MKYILFLFCILFFNLSVQADDSPGTTSTDGGVRVNLGNYKPDFMKSTDIPKNTDPFALSSTSSYYSLTPKCAYETPQYCKLSSSCIAVGGYWNFIDDNCGKADCHFGTTPDIADPTKCKCNGDPGAYVQRGNFLQSCPSSCFSQPNKYYSFMKKSCECNDGYTMAVNGTCNPNPAPPQPAQPVSDCLSELAEKAATCETSANTAVSKCEPTSEDDSLQALRGLLLSGKGSASENCDRAATASTSGYYQTDDTRKACDDGINSCKTTCEEIKTYLNANKERVYNACRDRAFQAQASAGPPLPADRFNPMWDSENKPTLDTQFQSLIAKIDSSHTTCDTGTAAKNREKLTAAMNEMDTSAKDASKCSCQLSGGSDCATAAGPADCSKNPSLAGCTKVADNCFDPKNTTLKCICFRNPESLACKEASSFNAKANGSDASALAGAKAVDTRANNKSDASGMAAGKNGEAITYSGGSSGVGSSLGGLNDSGLAAPSDASGSTVSSGENSVGGGKPAAVAAAGGGGGGTSQGANPSAVLKNNDTSVVKKLGGFFETAKSAVSGMFKKGSGDSEKSGNYGDGGNSSNPAFDSRKYRPRAVVRGVASEEEFAGKHEDIWKVMNKQYRVQDQKDNFIFDAGKN